MIAVTFGPRVKQTRKEHTREGKYPWAAMPAPVAVEGSDEVQYAQFFVPDKSTKKLAGLAYVTAKRLNVKFSLRNCAIEGENGETIQGVLVQRTE